VGLLVLTIQGDRIAAITRFEPDDRLASLREVGYPVR
jgi:hypothetical protein